MAVNTSDLERLIDAVENNVNREDIITVADANMDLYKMIIGIFIIMVVAVITVKIFKFSPYTALTITAISFFIPYIPVVYKPIQKFLRNREIEKTKQDIEIAKQLLKDLKG